MKGRPGRRRGNAQHVKTVSEQLKKASLQPFRQQDLPVLFVQSPAVDKDALARKVAQEREISSGLVCAISALEPSRTFEHKGTHIIRRVRPSHVPGFRSIFRLG